MIRDGLEEMGETKWTLHQTPFSDVGGHGWWGECVARKARPLSGLAKPALRAS